MIISTGKAIKAINPDAKYHIINDEINWLDGTAEISQADIDAKKAELQAKEDNRPNAKASAKAKLIAGEPLTEEEADAIVY